MKWTVNGEKNGRPGKITVYTEVRKNAGPWKCCSREQVKIPKKKENNNNGSGSEE
jgi:hypothetical protein